jgi:predicted transcriptional regulator
MAKPRPILTPKQRASLDRLRADSAEIELARRRLDRLVAQRHRDYQRLFDSGVPVQQIAQAIGVTEWAVRQYLKKDASSSDE